MSAICCYLSLPVLGNRQNVNVFASLTYDAKKPPQHNANNQE